MLRLRDELFDGASGQAAVGRTRVARRTDGRGPLAQLAQTSYAQLPQPLSRPIHRLLSGYDALGTRGAEMLTEGRRLRQADASHSSHTQQDTRTVSATHRIARRREILNDDKKGVWVQLQTKPVAVSPQKRHRLHGTLVRTNARGAKGSYTHKHTDEYRGFVLHDTNSLCKTSGVSASASCAS